MADNAQYITCLTSLPKTWRLEKLKHVPISEIRLRKRLSMLPPEDLRLLLEISRLIDWHQPEAIAKEVSEREYLKEAMALRGAIKDEELRNLINRRFDLLTVITALRLRKAGVKPQELPDDWGIGPYAKMVRKNWQQPLFGLERKFPWLEKGARLLENDQPKDFENLLSFNLWRELKIFSDEHPSDLPAIVAFVLQWNIADSWVQYDHEKAADRFSELVADCVTEDVFSSLKHGGGHGG